jgi:hypothetical protein
LKASQKIGAKKTKKQKLGQRNLPSPTSFRGELLSVGGEMTVADGGSPKISLLWKSPKLMDEIGGDAQVKKLQSSDKAVCGAEKQSSSSLQKSVTISDCVV